MLSQSGCVLIGCFVATADARHHHFLCTAQIAVDVFKAEKEIRPKLAALLKGDINKKYKEAAAIIARMDSLIARDPLAFQSMPDAKKLRLAFEVGYRTMCA